MAVVISVSIASVGLEDFSCQNQSLISVVGVERYWYDKNMVKTGRL